MIKIIVLHGDNNLKSYERLQSFIKEAKKRGWRIKSINSKEDSIQEALISETLFEKDKLVIVDNITYITPKVKKWLKKNSKKISTTLVIYHQKNIRKTFLKSIPKPDKVEEYSIPKLIWSFLDSFYPGNANNLLKLLHEIIKKEPPEFVFVLLAKLLRDLYWVKIDSDSLPYPDWRIGKLKRQALRFTNHQLTNLISELSGADIKVKTSKANLLDELDFIIASKLE